MVRDLWRKRFSKKISFEFRVKEWTDDGWGKWRREGWIEVSSHYLWCDFCRVWQLKWCVHIYSTPKELDPAEYGISATAVHSLDGLLHVGPAKLQTGDLVALLEDLYCGPIAAEFLHLQVRLAQCPLPELNCCA